MPNYRSKGMRRSVGSCFRATTRDARAHRTITNIRGTSMTIVRILARYPTTWALELIAFLAASSFTLSALAQTAPPTPPEPQLQEVIITGSRIPVPANISSTSPTTVVSNQEIQLQGHTDITDVINALPQNIILAVSRSLAALLIRFTMAILPLLAPQTAASTSTKFISFPRADRRTN